MNYIELLKMYKTYTNEYEDFNYQYIIDENLKRIREKYNLKKIAGDGDELSQIKNLLHWINKLLKHNGSANIPIEKENIDGIIEIGQREGSSCYSLSVALSEAYLSLGLKSRYIRCLPMSYEDGDCHVVVHVYSNQLKKWIMVDPTQNSYFMDENNMILSLAELRLKYINNEDIIINKDMSYNAFHKNQNSCSKEEYINYMAKNCFRFESKQVNGYSSARIENNKNIQLNPINFDGKENSLKNIDFRIRCVKEYCNLSDIEYIEFIEWIERVKYEINNNTIYATNNNLFWDM